MTRDEIRSRLASHPPLAELLTADDLEKQKLDGPGALVPAAVLLLVVAHEKGQSVLFTQRTAHLNAHAGQISFPGGRYQDGDDSPEATALREAEEEVGLPPDRVEILGRLPDYHTATGFKVTPIVGWVEPPLTYRPDPEEVAEVFEVPLEFLLDARNHQYESAFYKGRTRHYWAMPYGPRYIWGATAGMLVTFQRIVHFGA
ncbi:CoA pyrophosphatase [Usitatibacter palustris]|uniref:Putative Nudix hydrolase NudL n=1 Tax=Usitatibacter palustris TaxID=2732487 RepID=A0A6M4HAA4_9PROT|nr:CoA pyrophosphatase [Usitatibacter palustris]QJR15788.1 putative Nudix hydrolase NudL [Usitatibacter palustris]